MTESALDRAIREYRENPTEENKQYVLALQASQVQSFHVQQGDSYIRRTK